MDPHAVVAVNDRVVFYATAKSQRTAGDDAMDKETFQASKEAVLDCIAAQIGVGCRNADAQHGKGSMMIMVHILAAILGGGLSIVLFGFGVGLCLAPLFGSLFALGYRRSGQSPGDRMIEIVVKPAGRGRFCAMVGSRMLVIMSRTPFLTAARVLLADGVDPATPIRMRHDGSSVIALRSTVGRRQA